MPGTPQRSVKHALVIALVAGGVAAGVAYLLHLRPQWARATFGVCRHLWTLADGVVKRHE